MIKVQNCVRAEACGSTTRPVRICCKFGGATYGLVGDDEHRTGIEHVAMTVHADGMTHPFFTVPETSSRGGLQ